LLFDSFLLFFNGSHSLGEEPRHVNFHQGKT
jgi:hypothetical protein